MLAVELQMNSFHGCPVKCQADTRGWNLALPILDLSARKSGWPTPRSGHLTPGKRPIIHCTGDWLGLGAGLYGCRKSHLHQGSSPGPSSL